MSIQDKNSFLDPKLVSLYSNAVLLGNWFEQRVTRDEDLRDPKRKSEYQEKYIRKVVTEITSSLDPGKVTSGENVKLCLFNDYPYKRNMTRSSDVHYHQPQCESSERTYSAKKRTYLPEQDYLESYGNLTHFGLTDWYKCLKNKSNSRPIASVTKISYRCPNALFNEKRFAVPRWLSSKMNKNNFINENLQLRGYEKNLVPDNDDIYIE